MNTTELRDVLETLEGEYEDGWAIEGLRHQCTRIVRALLDDSASEHVDVPQRPEYERCRRYEGNGAVYAEGRAQSTMWALVAEMHAVNARVEAMKAENVHRTNCGNAIAYGDKSFSLAEDDLRGIAAALRRDI